MHSRLKVVLPFFNAVNMKVSLPKSPGFPELPHHMNCASGRSVILSMLTIDQTYPPSLWSLTVTFRRSPFFMVMVITELLFSAVTYTVEGVVRFAAGPSKRVTERMAPAAIAASTISIIMIIVVFVLIEKMLVNHVIEYKLTYIGYLGFFAEL